jgi:folate-binding protein YgfZ
VERSRAALRSWRLRPALEDITSALLAHAGERGVLATPEVFEAIRIEEGIARFGVDFDEQNYPQDASIEKLAVSFQKGCYLGQETVFMLEVRGHAKKRLVQLAIDGGRDVPVGAPITAPDDAAEVGKGDEPNQITGRARA